MSSVLGILSTQLPDSSGNISKAIYLYAVLLYHPTLGMMQFLGFIGEMFC